jgi:hypothetical protein
MGSTMKPKVPLGSRAALRCCVAILVTILTVVAAVAVPGAAAPMAGKALTKSEVIGLLKNYVPPERVAEIVRDQGITFAMTPTTEKELRDAGADDNLIKVLRDLAPQPAALPTQGPAAPATAAGPPVLMIAAQPGDAHVYIDDEPVGTTSPEGRLKFSKLAAGKHHIRLSLANYKDYEQDLSLRAGETTTVTATLAPRQTSPPPPAPASPQTPSTNSGAASLGVVLAPARAAGMRGVGISDVIPGGPADRAGLRPGYSIISIEGHEVSTPPQVQEVLATLRPGAAASVTYTNGSMVQTAAIPLVSRSSVVPGGGAQSAAGATGVLGLASKAVGANAVSFLVRHDHGMAVPSYCSGVMIIGNGRLIYRSTTGLHSFDVSLRDVKAVKKNGVYLALIGAFHVRLKKGTTYNFVVVNAQGQFQPPDPLLDAVDRAMGKR